MSQSQESAYLLSQVGGLAEAERLRQQAAVLLRQELELLLPLLPEGGLVLDLGCGSGLLADAIARARPDLRVLGVDADALAVAEARRVFGQGERLRFEQRRLGQGPAQDWGRADAAILRLVLMHLPQPEQALRDCQAWLKPGASLHVLESDDRGIRIEPYGPWLERLVELLQAVQRARGGDRQLGQGLWGLLQRAGWQPSRAASLAFELDKLGPAFGALFEPVVAFYLDQAVKAGLASAEEAQTLRSHVSVGCRGAFHRAEVPLFHVQALMKGS